MLVTQGQCERSAHKAVFSDRTPMGVYMTKIDGAPPKAAGHRSMDDFAARRLRLAGGRFIENGHCWFQSTDALAQDMASRGGTFTSFAHYDYLGLGETEAVKTAAKASIDIGGNSAGASRLVGGERISHGALESSLAGFLGYGATLVTISAYLANASLIPHLTGRRDLIVLDALAHNSLAMGARYSKARLETFAHNDLDELEHILKATRDSAANVLICVDALYSMDGDRVDLARLVEIKKRYRAWLILDEAHSFGTLGPTGAGLREEIGVSVDDVEFVTGSLSKSLASAGGFIAATPGVIEWLRFTLPSFVYSVGLPPASVDAAHTALNMLIAEPARLDRLRSNARLFARTARDAGFTVLGADGGPVQSVLFGSMQDTLDAAAYLQDHGIYAPPIAHVGVPAGGARIRFFLTAMHTPAEIARTIRLLQTFFQQQNVLQKASSAV